MLLIFRCLCVASHPEAATTFDAGPYPYLLLPRACAPLVLPGVFGLSQADIAKASPEESELMRDEVTKILDKTQRLKAFLDH